MFQRPFARRLQLAAAHLEVSGFIKVTVINGGSGQLSGDNSDKLLIERTVDAPKWSLEANNKILEIYTHARARTHARTRARLYK